jgi:hypothetical protein
VEDIKPTDFGRKKQPQAPKTAAQQERATHEEHVAKVTERDNFEAQFENYEKHCAEKKKETMDCMLKVMKYEL